MTFVVKAPVRFRFSSLSSQISPHHFPFNLLVIFVDYVICHVIIIRVCLDVFVNLRGYPSAFGGGGVVTWSRGACVCVCEDGREKKAEVFSSWSVEKSFVVSRQCLCGTVGEHRGFDQ